MPIAVILLPLFTHVALVFVALALGARAGRTEAAAPAIPAPAGRFALPCLFYVLTILALLTRKADIIFLVLAFIFVALQVLEFLDARPGANGSIGLGVPAWASLAVLAIMWVLFALAVLVNL